MPTTQETSNKATFKRFLDATNSQDGELISKTIDEVCQPDVLIRAVRVTPRCAVGRGTRAESRCRAARQGRPPTGKPVTYNEIFILRFVNGRIAETWGVVDVLAQMRQLGLIRAA